jgi:hypothetical protein
LVAAVAWLGKNCIFTLVCLQKVFFAVGVALLVTILIFFNIGAQLIVNLVGFGKFVVLVCCSRRPQRVLDA